MATPSIVSHVNENPHYQLLEIDSSVRPAQVKLLSVHSNQEEAAKAWKSSAFAHIDFMEISHRILKV